MNEQKYTSVLLDHGSQIKRLWMLVGALVLAILGLVILVFSLNKNEKTIVVPSGFDKPFTVRGNVYSNEYKEQMVSYVLQLLLNFQPSNVKYQFNEVLRYVHPNAYPTLRKKLSGEAQAIITDGASSVFYTNSIITDANEVTANGELVGSVGDRVVSRKTVTFKVTLDTNGGFYIMGWAQVIGDESNPPAETEEAKGDVLGEPKNQAPE